MLDLAIGNNVTWYTAVITAHGIPNAVDPHFWSTDGRVPPYYSNLVTRTADGEAAQRERIRSLCAHPPKPVWSLKDSHARLDLEPLGLRVLFGATWFCLPSGHAIAHEAACSFEAITDAAGLERWEAAWEIHSPSHGLRVFPGALLDDPDVTFLEATRDGDPIGGAILNRSEGALGLSNLFPGNDAALLRDVVSFARTIEPQDALVGYGSTATLEELAQLGFEDLGPLRIWISD